MTGVKGFRWQVVRRLSPRWRRGKRARGARAPLAQHSERAADADHIQPARQAAFTPPRVTVPHGPQEGFLHAVLGVLLVVEYALGDAVKLRAPGDNLLQSDLGGKFIFFQNRDIWGHERRAARGRAVRRGLASGRCADAAANGANPARAAGSGQPE